MKITEVRTRPLLVPYKKPYHWAQGVVDGAAVILVEVKTDEGISGYGEVEQYKPFLKPFVLYFREALLGQEPTDVERVMLRVNAP